MILLYKAYTGTIPLIFFNKFSRINHNYPTSSKNSGNYTIPKLTVKLTNFVISRRGPILWNRALDATLKETESLPLFKAKVKEILLSRENTYCSFIEIYTFVFICNYQRQPIYS